ncbi:MAG: MFS transporter [Chitinophagaceae bacterium]|nr:MFS transporter [Chitinophagaceae bacterium]
MPKLTDLSKAYSGISRNMWILAVAMFINRCGSMVLLFMSVYLTKSLHFSIPEAGFIMMLFGAGSIVGAFIGGKLVDTIGFYPILVWSLILCGIMLMILGQMHEYRYIAIFTFLVTATGDMFRPANSAAISSYSSKDNYPQSIALNRLAMNLGFTIGPVLGGVLATYSYDLLFWADGITCAFAAIFIFLILPNRKAIADEKDALPNADQGHISPYRDKQFIAFVIFTMLYALTFFQLITTLPLYFKEVYKLSEKHIGWLMALNGIGVAVIEMFLIYYIQDKWTKFKFIALGALLLIASYWILLPVHSLYILLLSMILITASEMLAMPFMSTYALKRANPGSMGQYMALYSMAWSIAQILAPLLGTQIIDRFGYAALFGVLGCIAMIPFLGFRWMDRQVQEDQPQAEVAA